MDVVESAPGSLAAAAAGLVYVSDAQPGIRRAREGTAFAYVLPDDRRITEPKELARIARLAVPPAYENVWICADPRGHLQATGQDARGRKQYRYHPDWRSARDGAKFDRMLAFGAALPRLRRRLRNDLALPGLPRDKVLAIIVRLLDTTRVRIGNTAYARDNQSYGLTTLRNRHVRFVCSGRLLLKFRGKGGAEHEVAIDDRRLAELVRCCHELPGQHLFQFVDDAGQHRPIDSDQVNTYLRENMGEAFTAKDFRTWGATVRAAVIMHARPLPCPPSERALNACVVDAVKQVAADLRNTPAVCRKSYINPVIFEAWRSGALHALLPASMPRGIRTAERPILEFLRRYAPGSVPAPARSPTTATRGRLRPARQASASRSAQL